MIAVSPGGYQPSESPHAAVFNRGNPVWLKLKPESPLERIGLSSAIQYRIEPGGDKERWKVTTAKYKHSIVDEEEHEVVSYHWHPEGTVSWPHMHVGSVFSYSTFVTGAHFPTGRVALEQIVRLIIEDFMVEPKRPDWDECLNRSLEAFQQKRNWS